MLLFGGPSRLDWLLPLGLVVVAPLVVLVSFGS